MSDFFRRNLPYGMTRNNEGKWMIYNRNYKPLGYCLGDHIKEDDLSPFYCEYKNLNEKLIRSILDKELIQVNDSGEIIQIFFYNDGTVPVISNGVNDERWISYIDKLKKLCNLECR